MGIGVGTCCCQTSCIQFFIEEGVRGASIANPSSIYVAYGITQFNNYILYTNYKKMAVGYITMGGLPASWPSYQSVVNGPMVMKLVTVDTSFKTSTWARAFSADGVSVDLILYHGTTRVMVLYFRIAAAVGSLEVVNLSNLEAPTDSFFVTTKPSGWPSNPCFYPGVQFAEIWCMRHSSNTPESSASVDGVSLSCTNGSTVSKSFSAPFFSSSDYVLGNPSGAFGFSWEGWGSHIIYQTTSVQCSAGNLTNARGSIGVRGYSFWYNNFFYPASVRNFAADGPVPKSECNPFGFTDPVCKAAAIQSPNLSDYYRTNNLSVDPFGVISGSHAVSGGSLTFDIQA